jgi:hypothetical protein
LRQFEEKYKSPGKAVELTVNIKEENSLRLLPGFRPRILPLHTVGTDVTNLLYSTSRILKIIPYLPHSNFDINMKKGLFQQLLVKNYCLKIFLA